MNASVCVCDFLFWAENKERQIDEMWNSFCTKFFSLVRKFFHNICHLCYFRVKHVLWKFNRNTCKYEQRIRIRFMHESIQGLLTLRCFTVHFDVDVFRLYSFGSHSVSSPSSLPLAHFVSRSVICFVRESTLNFSDEWWMMMWTSKQWTTIFIF